MHRRTTIALVTILLATLCCAASAAEYHVNLDGTGDFTIIQQAINAAQDGDTVVVYPGIYHENLLIVDKDIVLRSIDPESELIVQLTVIDGGTDESQNVIFLGMASMEAEISGLVLRNGYCGVGMNHHWYWHGYVYPTISNCVIKNNSFYGLWGCNGEILNCEITGNGNNNYSSGGGLNDCDGRIVSCSIRDNTAGGGGLYGCDGEIIDCEIMGNWAISEGGGLARCSGLIQGCTIEGNGAGYEGGGLYGFSGTIRDCVISQNGAYNRAEDGPYGGGGMSECDGEVLNCLIVENFSWEGPGGAIKTHRGRIANCTIVGNAGKYSYSTGGIAYLVGAIANCILWDNDEPELDYYSSLPINCCIQAWTEGGEGNFNANPLFVTGPLGDYYLSQRAAGQELNSPCVDAGSRRAVEAGLAEMTTRTDEMPDSGVVDIGYHYPTAESHVEVEVSCSLNAVEFAAGDRIQGFAGLENRGTDIVVDIFAAIIMADGSMISLTHEGFAVGIWPWYADLTLPSGFAAGPEMVFELTIPPDAAAGSYTYLTAVTRPGMGNFGLLSADQRPFQIHAPLASDYYVDAELGDDANDASEGAPWRTITHALDSLEGSEAHPVTVHVAAGTYSATANGETFPLNMKSWVSIEGESAERTILNAKRFARHVIYCRDVHNATIEGFSITGGQATGSYTGVEGGGGGICCQRSSPTIKRNIVRDNSASWFGGGIYGDFDSSPIILDNIVEDNESGTYGGGICAMGDSTIISGNYVAHNSTNGHSGGIQIQGDSPLLANNLIFGNSAHWGFGGGILCGTKSGLITNNTIYGNYGSCEEACVGGIYCAGGARPTIENCILWGNNSWDLAEEYTCDVKAACCCIGWPQYSMSGDGCITEDPMFAWGPLGDYYLDPASPCIDAGSQSAVDAGLSDRTTQDDGTPDSGIVDMGYHYPIPAGERPIAYIDSILPNPATQGVDRIQFAGHGTDADGTVQAHQWSSDLEGILSTSDHFSCPPWYLESGTHVISYRVQDDSGLWSEPVTEELVIEPQFPIPVAYIDSILPNPAVQGRDTVEFRGHGWDKDGPIEAYEWSSNLDGLLSVEKDFQRLATDLSPGTHTISFRVRDDDYQWSEFAIERLCIRSRETLEVFVNGETGDDSADGSQAAPFRTITHALAAVSASEASPAAILVAPGTYSASTNGETFPLTMKSFVSVSGGADTTILDGEGSAVHIICCPGVEDLIVEGLTMTGGVAYSGWETDQCGGAVYCVGGSVQIQSNIIAENYATVGGAGIYCYRSSPLIIANTISSNASHDYGGGICCIQSSPTILNNIITLNDAHRLGGGIYCGKDSSPLIEQNTILNNYAFLFGAGIYSERSSPTISNNLIDYNIVPSPATDIRGGGGICCKNCSPTITGNTITHNHGCVLGGGILCDESSPVISGNNISTNDVHDLDAIGGGIYCENNSSPTIEANTITGNSSWGNGGGIYCEHSSPMIVDNEVANNSVHDDGAGIGLSQSSPAIFGNVIIQNKADKRGGGILCALSSPTIFNNLIIGNEVYGRFGFGGGGVYVDCRSSPLITFSTVLDNLVPESRLGGGIYTENGGSPRVEDCIIWGNDDDLYNCSATFCCIEDRDEGEGNIHDDPMFVTGPLGEHYLHPDSPCIDAGSESAADAGLSDRTTQADGTPDTGIVDMGYHYPVPTE